MIPLRFKLLKIFAQDAYIIQEDIYSERMTRERFNIWVEGWADQQLCSWSSCTKQARFCQGKGIDQKYHFMKGAPAIKIINPIDMESADNPAGTLMKFLDQDHIALMSKMKFIRIELFAAHFRFASSSCFWIARNCTIVYTSARLCKQKFVIFTLSNFIYV